MRAAAASVSRRAGPLSEPDRAVLTTWSSLMRAADQVEIAADDHQEIVEVVSKPAGQLPDNFHFLRLVQKRLGALPHRDLVGEPNACVRQLLRALSQLAQIRHDAAHDSSALVVRQGRQRQINRHLRLLGTDKRQDNAAALRAGKQAFKKRDVGLKNELLKRRPAGLCRGLSEKGGKRRHCNKRSARLLRV